MGRCKHSNTWICTRFSTLNLCLLWPRFRDSLIDTPNLTTWVYSDEHGKQKFWWTNSLTRRPLACKNVSVEQLPALNVLVSKHKALLPTFVAPIVLLFRRKALPRWQNLRFYLPNAQKWISFLHYSLLVIKICFVFGVFRLSWPHHSRYFEKERICFRFASYNPRRLHFPAKLSPRAVYTRENWYLCYTKNFYLSSILKAKVRVLRPLRRSIRFSIYILCRCL